MQLKQSTRYLIKLLSGFVLFVFYFAIHIYASLTIFFLVEERGFSGLYLVAERILGFPMLYFFFYWDFYILLPFLLFSNSVIWGVVLMRATMFFYGRIFEKGSKGE